MDTSDKFEVLMQEVKDRLQSFPFFDDVPVFHEFERVDGSDIEALMDDALASIGIAVGLSIDGASLGGRPEGEWSVIMHDTRVLITVIENPTQNTISKRRGRVCIEIFAALQDWKPEVANSPLVFTNPGFERFTAPGGIGFDNSFTCTLSAAAAVTQVATPAITNDGGELTITCATSGAAIFYTENGKRPTPRNGTLYTGAFTPADPATVKARAFLAGYVESDTATP